VYKVKLDLRVLKAFKETSVRRALKAFREL
jgi:hypothetical protein